MSDYFTGEIRMMAFNFPPKFWALADGQIMGINQNQALFSLLGTTYGGDGRSTFALPDLRGRAAMHAGERHALGERGGEQNHTLSINEIPNHGHTLQATDAQGTTALPGNGVVLATSGNYEAYRPPATPIPLQKDSISTVGGEPHTNMQPYLTVTFCICLSGVFPSRN